MKKKTKLILVCIILLMPLKVNATRGCCSHHGGVSGCSSSGRLACNDGTLSPSCTCTPTYIYGCTDSRAKNYNKNANKDNGKCVYYKYGCTDINSINYDSTAEKDDNSCQYTKNVIDDTNKSEQDIVIDDKTVSDNENNRVVNSILELGTIGTIIYFIKRKK